MQWIKNKRKFTLSKHVTPAHTTHVFIEVLFEICNFVIKWLLVHGTKPIHVRKRMAQKKKKKQGQIKLRNSTITAAALLTYINIYRYLTFKKISDQLHQNPIHVSELKATHIAVLWSTCWSTVLRHAHWAGESKRRQWTGHKLNLEPQTKDRKGQRRCAWLGTCEFPLLIDLVIKSQSNRLWCV